MANYIQQECLQFYFSLIMLAKVLRQKNFPYYGFNKVDIVIGIFQFTEFKYFIENIWFWTVGNVIHEDVSQTGFFLTLTSPLSLSSHPGKLVRLDWDSSFNKFIMQLLCFRVAQVIYFFVAPEIQRTRFYL